MRWMLVHWYAFIGFHWLSLLSLAFIAFHLHLHSPPLTIHHSLLTNSLSPLTIVIHPPHGQLLGPAWHDFTFANPL